MDRNLIRFGLLPALILRVILIIYSSYHDRHSLVKYTDIDYEVYTQAAKFIISTEENPIDPLSSSTWSNRIRTWSGLGSPYQRDTYRYTPLLALLVLPNHFLHPTWGKFLFSFADLIIGVLLYDLISHDLTKRYRNTIIIVTIWLLNPIVANISTRGSSESIVGSIVIGSLYLCERGRWKLGAMLLGLGVHFKIYPLIYGASIWSRLDHLGRSKARFGFGWVRVNWDQFLFTSIAVGTLSGLSGLMYLIWGPEFIQHSYLYHLHRLDHRHNFSPYFYPIYLNFFEDRSSDSGIILTVMRNPLISFLPQIGLSIGLGLRYGNRDMRFGWFVQTLAFVGFNKVVTSQYFLWYLWFVPLVLDRIRFSKTRLVIMISSWTIAQALWLGQAYRLEFLGLSVFREVWICSLIFFIVNVWILGSVLEGYRIGLIEKPNDKIE